MACRMTRGWAYTGVRREAGGWTGVMGLIKALLGGAPVGQRAIVLSVWKQAHVARFAPERGVLRELRHLTVVRQRSLGTRVFVQAGL